jgi:hypothetical protein
MPQDAATIEPRQLRLHLLLALLSGTAGSASTCKHVVTLRPPQHGGSDNALRVWTAAFS